MWIVIFLIVLVPASVTAFELRDVTQASGIDFVHHNGGVGDRWLPETMGSGVAVLDANEDGIADLFFVDGRDWNEPRPIEGSRLYLGRGKLRFVDATAAAQLPSGIFGMGAVSGDLDGDGHADLVLTALDGVRVLWGTGTGAFVPGGPIASGWATSACLLDFDRDGRLDLFVARYVHWTRETDLWCTIDGTRKTYCTPELYPETTCVLLRGTGDRRFLDVSSEAGLGLPAKALGVLADDFDGDGWLDLFVANDTLPDLLLLNRADGTFEEIGLASGIALDLAGTARAGMGVDAADYMRSGRPGVAVGHFSGEMLGLFRNEGAAGFFDEATRRRLGPGTLPELTFGLLFADLDLDGWSDLITANGHIESEIASFRPAHRYRQPLGLYRNVGGAEFVRQDPPAGATELVARGLAAADLDADGDLDLILTQNGDRPVLLRNDTNGTSLRFRLPDAPGTRVTLFVDGEARTQTLHLGNSYLSCSEPVLTFGVDGTSRVERATVQWPSGSVTELSRDQLQRSREWNLREESP